MKSLKICLCLSISVVFAFCLTVTAEGWKTPDDLMREAQGEQPTQPTGPINYYPEAEDAIFDMTNAIRVKHKLSKVNKDSSLREAARLHSADMLKNNFMGHGNPAGLSPQDRVNIHHRKFIGLVFENVAFEDGYYISKPLELAERTVTAWMKSPGHRENILRPELTHLGVGVAFRDVRVLFTQKFTKTVAYLDSPLPKKVKRGTPLNLNATPFPSSGTKPVKFDYSVGPNRKEASKPFDIANAKADIAPGTYYLRHFFPMPNRSYSIYFGPQIEVVQ